MVVVADGTPDARRRLERVLTTDPGTGAAWDKRDVIGSLRRSDLYGLFLTLANVTNALHRYLERNSRASMKPDDT